MVFRSGTLLLNTVAAGRKFPPFRPRAYLPDLPPNAQAISVNRYSRFTRLLRRAGRIGGPLALLWLLLPLAGHAQSGRPLLLTTYYDSARTQRHVVYRARRVGADTVAHGPFRRYWPGGSLQELGHFTEGQADSIWTRYYPAKPGQPPALARRLPMRNGKPEGAFTVWHPDGRVGQRGTFRGGQLVDSLVTLTATGQRRLTAQLSESSDGRLQGRFWQRGSRFTAQYIDLDWVPSPYNYGNPYPDRNAQRYWQGQLVAGHPVGTLTEYDADGQPTIRLSYTAQGHLRLITRYFPAAWRRFALLQDYDEATRRDSVVPGHLFWQWESVGARGQFVRRIWGPESETPQVELLREVPVTPQRRWSTGDVVGARDQAARLAGVSPDLTARLARFTTPAPAADCPEARAAYTARLRPHMVLVKAAPGRWLLGEADTTGATHRPLRRALVILPDGRRRVETARRTRTYYANGTRQSVEYRRRLGRELSRDYYPSGRRQGVDRRGLLASYDRSWNEEGQKVDTELDRLLGVRMIRKRVVRHRKGQRVTVYVTRPHLWESKKSQRRRYRPH